MKKKALPKFTRSSGNVFADLGVSNPEEALAKSQLAAQISAIVSRRGLTQVAAAKALGIPQSKVSGVRKPRVRKARLRKPRRLPLSPWRAKAQLPSRTRRWKP